jgi:aryl-alcohol dehydrogenase-like predicted oxidoreductase
MAQGILTGKYLPGEPPPEGSRATDEASGKDFISAFLSDDDLLERVQRLKPLAAEAGIEMSQMAVAWVLRNPNVASAIVGASRPDQLDATVAAAEITLDDDLVAAIDDVLGDKVERSARQTKSPRTRP